MVERRYGRIIMVASIAAERGYLRHAPYAASKAGLLGLAKSVAPEVAPYGVTVNCVSPGITATQMAGRLSEEARQAIVDIIPIGRMADPGEVANLVCFLASNEASYITGQNLLVTGGR